MAQGIVAQGIMTLSLRQLEALRAIFEAGSITAAARALGVSQPAISRLLKQAEDRAGVHLFQRHGNRLLPTAEVRVLLPGIARVFSDVEAVRQDLENLREARGAACTVATTPALGFALLHPAIVRLRQRKADARITVEPLLNHEVIESVHGGRAAFGLILAQAETGVIGAGDLAISPMVCVMPKGHVLTRCKRVTIAELVGHPLISFDRTLPLGKIVHELFSQSGARMRLAAEIGSSLAACDLVHRGAGITVIEGFTAYEKLPPGLVVRPVQPTAWVAARVVQDRPLSPIAQALLEETRAAVAEKTWSG